MEDMDVHDILKRMRLDLARLAEKSGVDYGYLRQLSARNQGAGAPTRAKIAAAFRAHAEQLVKDAERLERDD
jgi:transcriptional regulator with XRE-family HTH domain